MAQPPPAKRKREDEVANHPQNQNFINSYATAPVPPVDEMVTALSDQAVRAVLIAIAQNDPSRFAHSSFMDNYAEHIKIQRSKVRNFDHRSKVVWHTLNTSYFTKLSSSKQYDASFDAFNEIKDSITTIASQTPRETSYDTKLSALETLRKIAKTILLSDGDCLQSEVRKQFQYDTCLEDTMLKILQSMSSEEVYDAGENISEPGKPNLLEKLRWVESEARGYCVFADVANVVEFIERANPDNPTPESSDLGDLEEREEDEDEDEEDELEVVGVQPQHGQRQVIQLD